MSGTTATSVIKFFVENVRAGNTVLVDLNSFRRVLSMVLQPCVSSVYCVQEASTLVVYPSLDEEFLVQQSPHYLVFCKASGLMDHVAVRIGMLSVVSLGGGEERVWRRSSPSCAETSLQLA